MIQLSNNSGATSTATTPVDCVCCGNRLPESRDFCEDCWTPTCLSHSVASRDEQASFISVLGASNAGKTVYLGLLLDILGKGTDEFRGHPTSSFSVDLQEQVINALEHRTFPEKTPAEVDLWRWVHCQISLASKKGDESVDLISPDFAGEAIAQEVNQAGMYPAIQHVVTQSSGVLILCDSVRVRDSGSAEDLFAIKLASYVASSHGLSEVNRKKPRGGPAVAIVFTKADGCPEAMDNPEEFAANSTPRLFEFCRRTFQHHQFFAASVAGSSGVAVDYEGCQTRVPFHIQPQGILEPLQWIVTGN